MNIKIKLVDYNNPNETDALLELLDIYAQDPMGGGHHLTEYSRTHLIEELKKLPYVFSLIAYDENKPIGLMNCIETFSTFASKKVINVHDVVVIPEYRGKKVSKLLFAKLEEISKEKDCCKITLEVLEGNKIAQSAYKKLGFNSYELGPEVGRALFWEKKLN